MDLVRRPGGAMEPHRRPAGRRVLLPAEVAVCEALGLSVDDYFYFLSLTESYTGERRSEYELVPNVTNDVVSVIVSVVIGIALSAVSYLLTPKPRSPQTTQKAPPSLRTEDLNGQRRFAPQTSFDSVQELATLGTVIPLVFTRKGVRVNGTLLWSQMLSLGTGQQLRALVLFSAGELEQRPDFAGFAIGDALLANYTNAKLALYFKTNGGRPLEGTDRYPEGTAADLPHRDAFSVFWDRTNAYEPFFSGTRSPSTQAQFGAYAPMPNGMVYKVNYELVLRPKDADSQVKKDNQAKWDKINTGQWPHYSSLVPLSGGSPSSVLATQGQRFTYVIGATRVGASGYMPWGTQDVESSIESTRINTDESIRPGEQYLLGTAMAVAETVPSEPWQLGSEKSVVFRVIEPGAVDTRLVADLRYPYESLTVQRAAVATVTNNRACDVTEIGIKSTVWRQIAGFPNVNSYPGDSKVDYYERNNGALSLGNANKYIRRLSFFTLEARKVGQSAWNDITNGTVFCVEGQTPQPQYNFIRVSHPRGQYEYRFKPCPGNSVLRFQRNQSAYLLRAGRTSSYSSLGYFIAYSGSPVRLTDNFFCNSEWVLGTPPAATAIGAVDSLADYSSGAPPLRPDWQLQETRNGKDNAVVALGPPLLPNSYNWRWDGKTVATSPGYVIGDTIQPREPVKEVVVDNVKYVRADSPTTPGDGTLRYAISRYNPIKVETEAPVFIGTVSAVGGGGVGLTVNVRRFSNGSATWTIVEPGTGYANGAEVTIPQANVTTRVTTSDRTLISPSNLNPYDAVADFVLYEAERSSHQDGPEHEVCYINEQLQQTPPSYTGLALAGLRINSGIEWSSFSQLSAYVKGGIRIERPGQVGRASSNLLPDIAYSLLTDPVIGAGNLVGKAAVNEQRMATASRFCQANGFTWDGVITERLNLRSWIFEQAGYCLLDFTIIGGQFSLVPAVPYDSAFRISPSTPPTIKALFTDGNIRDLKVSFLSPEERQLFRATVLWRFDTDNGFPQTRTVSVRLSDEQGGSSSDPEETFDLSGFCTTVDHAFTFARYALKVRKEVDHGIKFQTTPQAAMSLSPGDYFRLVSEATHTSRFQNGSIDSAGTIVSAQALANGSYSVLYWVPGTTSVQTATMTVSDGRTSQSSLWGTLFTINNTTTTNRVYKVESLSYAEDGLIEVAASYTPLTSTGGLAVLNWPDSHFVAEFS